MRVQGLQDPSEILVANYEVTFNCQGASFLEGAYRCTLGNTKHLANDDSWQWRNLDSAHGRQEDVR